MTALSDALTATQSRAVAALGKSYLAGTLDAQMVLERLVAVGLPDVVDADQWIAALDVLREHGAQAPAEPKPQDNRATPTGAQLDYLKKLAGERNFPVPAMVETLSRDQVSSIIDAMKHGSYDPEAVPF